MATKHFTGSINVSRLSDGTIRIQLEESNSGVRMFEVVLTPEQFGNAISGLLVHDVTIATWDNQIHWGRSREFKTEVVEVAGVGPWTNAQLDAILAPYAAEGWEGRRSDIGNMHRRMGKGYQVHFTRWID